ncbi:flagellar biosynthesis anti-sigma factor FlgM [Rubinisphaera margarita]|uniref:flagellar biosynthesis anti-sigma factor FlgM n=1 Tax=Rubinisphaera margarita TaxID=2909586 RepID=UPI001EE8AEDC|nr:flagellar biosynthesis anti-sigma factor FlgM [Rubinisphaera margarita]MCG6154211.1 flagellar biosynthesis anti-sigma factor FlgM [Rubinisphaera margarita]
MAISGIGGSGGNMPVSRVNHPVQQTPFQPTPGGIRVPTDQLDISPMARMMSELQSLEENDPSRSELIARIRDEIANGTYDTDEKLEAALANFLRQVQNDS